MADDDKINWNVDLEVGLFHAIHAHRPVGTLRFILWRFAAERKRLLRNRIRSEIKRIDWLGINVSIREFVGERVRYWNNRVLLYTE